MCYYLIMMKKVLDFIKSRKFLDIFSYVFCGIYFVFALFFAISTVVDSKQLDAEFNDLVARVNAVNKQVENSKFFDKKDNTETVSKDPLFTDGKTALITAYSKLYNAKSFYAKIDGTLSTSVYGIDVRIKAAATAVKFNENKVYNELLIKYLDSSTLGSMLEDTMRYGTQAYRNNGPIKTRMTYEVSHSGSSLVATGYGASSTSSEEVYMIADNLLKINEDTITNVSYFKIKEKNGVPQYYYVKASLNPETAAENFAKATKFRTRDFYFGVPKYTSITVTACIDAYGNLVGFSSSDVSNVGVSGAASLTAPCKYSLTYVITGIDQDINFEVEGF